MTEQKKKAPAKAKTPASTSRGLTPEDLKRPGVRRVLDAQNRVHRAEKALAAARAERDQVVDEETGMDSPRGLLQRFAYEWKITRGGVDEMKKRAKRRREAAGSDPTGTVPMFSNDETTQRRSA